jgi:hypothetical protein
MPQGVVRLIVTRRGTGPHARLWDRLAIGRGPGDHQQRPCDVAERTYAVPGPTVRGMNAERPRGRRAARIDGVRRGVVRGPGCRTFTDATWVVEKWDGPQCGRWARRRVMRNATGCSTRPRLGPPVERRSQTRANRHHLVVPPPSRRLSLDEFLRSARLHRIDKQMLIDAPSDLPVWRGRGRGDASGSGVREPRRPQAFTADADSRRDPGPDTDAGPEGWPLYPLGAFVRRAGPAARSDPLAFSPLEATAERRRRAVRGDDLDAPYP